MIKKILIIDDNEFSSNVIKTNLEQNSDYEVMVETSGTRGLSVARKLKPNLILLDIMMPGKDGFEVLGDLKKNNETVSIPIVMISAMDDKEAKVKAMQLYCEDYLVKPFTPEALEVKIEGILKIRKIAPPVKKGALKTIGESIDNAAQQAKEKQKSKIKQEHKPGAVIKILVVDDEKTVCDLIKSFLTPLDFKVYSCWHSKEAMTLFMAQKPDIVILDLVMPKVDGMEILCRIKELKTKTRVIVLTGVNDLMVIKDATKLGADDIIVKPFSLNQMSVTLTKHLSMIYEGYKP